MRLEGGRGEGFRGAESIAMRLKASQLANQPASQPVNKRRYDGHKVQVVKKKKEGKGQIGLAIRLVQSDRFEIHTAQMQVQDFTVIRISPIVYNDRDILEIGVISQSPQTGHTNTNTHKILQQQQVMHVLANTLVHTHTNCSNTQNKESASVLTTQQK